MKQSLPTILLACALIAAFSVGYFLRDAQESEPALRERSDGSRMTLVSAPRRVEIVRPADPGEEEDAGNSRFFGGNSNPSSETWSSGTNRRPSQNELSQFGPTAMQPMPSMSQMRTLVLPTFYVPVRAGRPPLSGSDKKTDKKQEEEPQIPRTASYAVFAPGSGDNEVFTALKELLVGEEEKVTVEKVDTVSDGIASQAEVLILCRGRGSIPRISRDLIEPFKKRKVIVIGAAAATLLDQAGLKIGRTNIAFASAAAPLIPVAENSVANLEEKPTSLFDPPPGANDPFVRETFFAYYLGPLKPSNREGIEVIAHLQGDEDFAPIVRQENAILIGVNGRIGKWTPAFREVVRKVAAGLAQR